MGSDGKSRKRRSHSSSPSSDEGDRKRRKQSKRDGKEGKSRKDSGKEDKKKKKHKDKKSQKHSKRSEGKEKKSGEKRKSYIKDFQEISKDDYFSKSNEFALWLKEERGIFFSDLSSEASRDLFSKFIRDWNKQKLESQYYEGIARGPRTAHTWVPTS